MVLVALFFVAMLALWLFVRIDQRRLKDSRLPPLFKKSLDGGFTPGLTTSWMPYAGIAAACALTAINGFINPEMPPFTGRWSDVRALLHAVFGPYGWSGVFTVGAIAFAIQAVAKYEEGAAQRRKQNGA